MENTRDETLSAEQMRLVIVGATGMVGGLWGAAARMSSKGVSTVGCQAKARSAFIVDHREDA